jgi:protoheme IX farnesyltransferase
MKFRLSALVVVTTAVGAAVASEGAIDLSLLAVTVLGTGLAAGGANGLNQWIERELDARMVRTARRPLPSGRMKPRTGLALALGAAVAGPVLLGVTTNLLTAVLAAVTTLLYVLVYTPLKRKDPACTLVGAVCGAIPPMMGVSAVTGSLDFRAGLLFVALFVWQIPHFLSLAWLYRDDYERGGFRMMPVVDRTGATTTRMVLAYTVVLMPLGVAMTLSGMAGWWFTVGAVILGAAFSAVAVLLYRRRTAANARRVFYASLVYLPLLLGLLVLDRGPAPGITPWNEIGFHIVEMPRVPPAARRPLFVPDAGPGPEVLYGPDASPAPDALPDASPAPDAVPWSAPDVLPEAPNASDALPLPDAPDAPAAP